MLDQEQESTVQLKESKDNDRPSSAYFQAATRLSSASAQTQAQSDE